MPKKIVTIGKSSLTLDARPDRLDLRDRPYTPRLGNLPERFPTDAAVEAWLPKYTQAGLVRDQGEDGACTGFGLAAVVNYLLFTQHIVDPARPMRSVSPAMLYQLARLYDEWPGEDYEGSSCRGALKGWQRHGVCRDELWPYSATKHIAPHENADERSDPERNWDVDALDRTLGVYYRVDSRSIVDLQSALCETGAIYVSATVHEGWAVPTRKRIRGHADLVRIEHIAKPKDEGGHAFAIVGYNEHGFVVQNSWGGDWGSGGFALLPYEAWVAHGDDAWVFTLGVSRLRAMHTKTKKAKTALAPMRTSRFFVPSMEAGDTSRIERPMGLVGASDALSRRYSSLPEKHRPLDTDDAYRHAIVMDRGFPLCNDITSAGPAAALEAAAYTRPLAWRDAHGAAKLKLLIYAHGGLNSESDSIQRVRAMAPYALDAGLYPLFLTWRSGPLETVSDMAEEVFARLGFGARGALPARGWLDRITEKTDRLLEPLLRAPGGAMWSQMKLNAARASEHTEGACRLMVKHLVRLAASGKLELHLVGHSAGAIVLGWMLDALRAAKLPVASLRLFAPACTTRFALDHYEPAVKDTILSRASWFVHVLSDENERADSVGPYRKSLLYLVSRAFEDDHKTPLLGLERTFHAPDESEGEWSAAGLADVKRWATFWGSHAAGNANKLVLAARKVSNGVAALDASHGCFDNAVDIVSTTLSYAAGSSVKVRRLDY
jgi:hypothetical protein